MSSVGDLEERTKKHLVALFSERLIYTYLGDWRHREGNSNVEVDLLTSWLRRQGHTLKVIGKVLRELDRAKTLGGGKNLYDANRAVYDLLRYGVKIKADVGEQHETVWLVDWTDPENNDFAIAEEVTIGGAHEKRPDIVVYVNGIAFSPFELKRSVVSVAEGIRQNLDNQKKEFIRPFFATVQLIIAGNDTEGLRYGVIGTPEKHYLAWKEPCGSGRGLDELTLAGDVDNPLDRAVLQLFDKARLLEMVHDFVVYDAGTKKVCRPNQYFGVKLAHAFVERREGGIIWHTQGSGKSLTMVWLAKWIREHVPGSRVLILTDRTELDGQIKQIFNGVNEDIYRTKSGADLVRVLEARTEWLMCSLVHKFGRSEDASVQEFVGEFRKQARRKRVPDRNLFVFVDECHRTHSGKLHDAMKALLPDATFFGFTGTPILRADKKRSIEQFGPFIHTYKYDEGVRDGVVLDLRYEARDIDQRLTSQDKIDKWFGSKTSGLTDYARARLKQRWGTMQKLLSSRSRLDRIAADMLFDMEVLPRLKSGRGNAILACDSIYEACLIYDHFQKTDLADKCAIVTSFRPNASQIKGEESGEGETERVLEYKTYRRMLAEYFNEPEDDAVKKIDQFEEEVKKRFIEQPGQMKLLIVVDKLLTGFDAPPATYLYLDKHLQDHGLFQATGRVNRVDTEDKDYGYVIDYKDLFKSLERAVRDYTGGALEGYDAEDVAGLLGDRLEKGQRRLDDAREAIKALCEPVERPRDSHAYIHYFCGIDTSDGEQLLETSTRRVALYERATALARAYVNLANDMEAAGYTCDDAATIKDEVHHYDNVRKEIMLASGDYVDLKQYEPHMRQMIDAYVQADPTEALTSFDDLSLVEFISEHGESGIDALPLGIRRSTSATAETIEHNVRKVIVDEMAVNPRYYEKMSALLADLIKQRKAEALDYKDYLARIVELAKIVTHPEAGSAYPASITTPATRALYDNLGEDEALAVELNNAIVDSKMDGWRGHRMKEKALWAELRQRFPELAVDDDAWARLQEIIRNQSEY